VYVRSAVGWSHKLQTHFLLSLQSFAVPYCDEEAVEQCLEELMDSDYGKTMFGRHDLPASVG
jgi:uncharacterized protein YlbG (UPF0298 family)